ncbi:hypothetical protein BCR34DRAFT_559697 [Clohesyomyces aquaticus]|uniref:Zn(2)-C6 fungal-type domain-containing protein n=1 Tax=Clohesyomyces aquaticus TaxID=1231657 RepID=A0A1Y1ZXE4_9PLEO|nr:hypothetical protein BCR34DRAFT_559697 [Clohesyomyces aquaticus]
MDNDTPALRLAGTDNTGAVKRRRPALSCVECRRRKVKCDRDRPCGPCTRTKSPTCTYRPARHTASRHEANRNPSLTSAQAADFDAMLNRYIAPGILGPHGSVTLSHLPGPAVAPARSSSASTQSREGIPVVADGGPPDSSDPPLRASASMAPGQLIKSKFYGETHWVNAIEPYEALGDAQLNLNVSTDRTEINRNSELYQTVLECKRMARTIKALRCCKGPEASDIRALMPTQSVCDQLVHYYLRTQEGVFRVLHIPMFLKEYDAYWDNPTTANPMTLFKILLVCAIGNPFYDGPESVILRASCAKWIQACESFLSSPGEKSRLNLAGLQLRILLLLAREVYNEEGDLNWIPAGALLRSAMHIGLHRDPSHFPKLSVFHSEMRRRLWATVLELTVQSSLDMGMPPMISMDDFDTLPPSNINDEDIGEGINVPLKPKPEDTFTQTSTQIALNRSLPLRLEITRRMNSVRSELNYDQTLRLGAELLAICRSNIVLFQKFVTGSSTPPVFQTKLLDVLTRRYVLNLHRPFFAKAKTDPRYYFSRKMCLDTSLHLLAPTSVAQQNHSDDFLSSYSDDWTKLTHHAVGFFKSMFFYSITTVYLELLTQIEEQEQDVAPFPTPSNPPSSNPPSNTPRFSEPIFHPNPGLIPTPESTTASIGTSPVSSSGPRPSVPLPPRFDQLRSTIVAAHEMSIERMKHGEMNAKGRVFFACTLARIDAIVTGANPYEAVLDAAKTSVISCAELIKKAYRDENGVELNFRSEAQDPECFADGVGTAGGGFEGLGDLQDMEWDALMQDGNMDFGFGLEGNESWWFGVGDGSVAF